MNISSFQSRLVRNKALRIDELVVFLDWGRKKVLPGDFVNFIKGQQALIAEEKRKKKGLVQHG